MVNFSVLVNRSAGGSQFNNRICKITDTCHKFGHTLRKTLRFILGTAHHLIGFFSQLRDERTKIGSENLSGILIHLRTDISVFDWFTVLIPSARYHRCTHLDNSISKRRNSCHQRNHWFRKFLHRWLTVDFKLIRVCNETCHECQEKWSQCVGCLIRVTIRSKIKLLVFWLAFLVKSYRNSRCTQFDDTVDIVRHRFHQRYHRLSEMFDSLCREFWQISTECLIHLGQEQTETSDNNIGSIHECRRCNSLEHRLAVAVISCHYRHCRNLGDDINKFT